MHSLTITDVAYAFIYLCIYTWLYMVTKPGKSDRRFPTCIVACVFTRLTFGCVNNSTQVFKIPTYARKETHSACMLHSEFAWLGLWVLEDVDTSIEAAFLLCLRFLSTGPLNRTGTYVCAHKTGLSLSLGPMKQLHICILKICTFITRGVPKMFVRVPPPCGILNGIIES